MVSSIGGMPSMNPQMLTQMREKMFGKLDADGDGSITKAELEAAPKPEGRGGKAPDAARMLQDFDGDGDGAITQSEMTSGFQRVDARMQSQFLRMQEAGGGRGPGGPGGEPPSIDEMFGKLDADGDGSISKTELENGKPEAASDRPPSDAERMLADLDGDGAISKEEMTAGFEKRAKEREAGSGIERQRQQMLSYFLQMQETQQAA